MSGTAQVVYCIAFALIVVVATALPLATGLKAVLCAALWLALGGFAYWAERRGLWPD